MSEKEISELPVDWLEQIVELVKPFAEAGSKRVGDFYIDGKVVIRHVDGFQVGTLHAEEDWWVFTAEHKD